MDIAILKDSQLQSKCLYRTSKITKEDTVEGTEKDDKFISYDEFSDRRNKFPLSTNDSLCLVLSSCFFLIPAYYAFFYGFYMHFITSLVTTIVSINYWRRAVPGWRASLDFCVAKLSFVIYFITGFLHIKDIRTLIIAWPVCIFIFIFYLFSNKMWDKDCFTWVYYHMSFHLFVAIEQFIVLNSLFNIS